MTLMQLVIDGDSVSFESRIKLDNFPDLVRAHLAKDFGTEEYERLGQKVKAEDFKWKYLEPFIRKVCRWGGHAGIGGRVVKNNLPKDIEGHFRVANIHMGCERPSIAEALQEINKIKGLGTPSFASKHLRFLWPQFCPILDSRMTWLGYEFTLDGYPAFAKDCAAIANALTLRGTLNPFPGRPEEWFVSDIDMALFARLSGWK